MNPIDPRVHPDLVPEGSKPVRIAEKQEEYITLPSIRTPAKIKDGEILHPGYVITRWEPSAEERAAILRGEDIYITLVTAGSINPMFVTVGQCNWKE